MSDEVIGNPWEGLRRFTSARIALGRAGDSLPTEAVLDFGLAHAQARDAVHQALDVASLQAALQSALETGLPSLTAQSAAPDRAQYLLRPDLGRRLDSDSAARLDAHRESAGVQPAGLPSIAFVIADGLSSFAPQRHALPLLDAVLPRLRGWSLTPVVIATQARVALGDEIGERLGADVVVMLIGERPGLSSPDSLGIYLTWRPHVGRSDAERNCISNVRPEGLGYHAAAHKLHYLLTRASKLGATGVVLKDDSAPLLEAGA